ncbi:hypothetical protein CVT26_014085 [Gymnopilus dilepis]|uniref:Uncharacterized protein n=1 Tax=Gymnopilus dilepis TaxID=231916 RepID=A0A409VX56_9AGAR|nr:hypothetical protein CVT26_014085 [Gymnopilus dilepis]
MSLYGILTGQARSAHASNDMELLGRKQSHPRSGHKTSSSSSSSSSSLPSTPTTPKQHKKFNAEEWSVGREFDCIFFERYHPVTGRLRSYMDLPKGAVAADVLRMRFADRVFDPLTVERVERHLKEWEEEKKSMPFDLVLFLMLLLPELVIFFLPEDSWENLIHSIHDFFT